MAYKVIILYRLYMPSYVLGTFTEYPQIVKGKFENVIRYFQISPCLLLQLKDRSTLFIYKNDKQES